MRQIAEIEKQKRGCGLCNDVTSGRKRGKNRTMCPHEICPYAVLDKYDSYEEFIKSEDSKVDVAGLFCHESGDGRLTLSAKNCRPVQKSVYKRYF